jgi:hypothetical protein
MTSEMLVAVAILFSWVLSGTCAALVFLFVEHARREAERQRDVIVMFAAALKASSPQEAVDMIRAVQATTDDELETVDAPPKPEYLTDDHGNRFKIGMGENGLEILETEDGKKLEIIR